ncbi:glycosyltransferase family 4 protein [Patescibacteria group bacterium]
MRVALNINSLKSGHKYRGLGFYTKRLLLELEQLSKSTSKSPIQLIKFDNKPPKKADIVHYPAFTLFQPKKNISFKNKIIFTVHDLIPLKFPKRFPLGIRAKLAWFIQKNNLKKASVLITDSKASKKDIIRFAKIQPDKIKVIYLAADKVFKPLKNKTWLASIKKRYQLPDKFIFYVGDLNYNKNIPLLAQTCLDLDFPLVVVGKRAVAQDFDEKHPETQDLVQFQALAKNNPQKIIRLGFVPTKDLVGLYNLATVYAHPSIAEGFGLPILEAMACGCPVITSRTSSLAEIAGQAALLVNPASRIEITKALKSLWQKPALRQKLSKLGLERNKKFSWQKTAQQTYEVYKKTI